MRQLELSWDNHEDELKQLREELKETKLELRDTRQALFMAAIVFFGLAFYILLW